MDFGRLREVVRQGAIETVIVAGVDFQGRLLGKRMNAHFFLEDGRDGVKLSVASLAEDIENEIIAGLSFGGLHTGFNDLVLQPDLSTIRFLPWIDKTALVLADTQTADGDPIACSPRALLRTWVGRAAAKGFTVKSASELEFYLLRENSESVREKKYLDLVQMHGDRTEYSLLRSAQDEWFLGLLRSALGGAGISVESSKSEDGPGQVEINLLYTSALEGADRSVLFKQATKEIAALNGLLATFMARPFTAFAGSSCHIHMSLWQPENRGAEERHTTVTTVGPGWTDRETGGEGRRGTGHGRLSILGQVDAPAEILRLADVTDPERVEEPAESRFAEVRNAFGGESPDPRLNPVLYHFLGGIQRLLPDFFLLYAPLVNSYKRYAPGSFAPTSNSWGIDNRTAALRVVGRGESRRIENRVPGADTNPYLANVAMLASGLYGLEHELEPLTPPAVGDANREAAPPLPRDLFQAIDFFRASNVVKEQLGQEVANDLALVAQAEAERHRSLVSDWERRIYLEHA